MTTREALALLQQSSLAKSFSKSDAYDELRASSATDARPLGAKEETARGPTSVEQWWGRGRWVPLRSPVAAKGSRRGGLRGGTANNSSARSTAGGGAPPASAAKSGGGLRSKGIVTVGRRSAGGAMVGRLRTGVSEWGTGWPSTLSLSVRESEKERDKRVQDGDADKAPKS